MERWTTYEFPDKPCHHAICDGQFCILNPIPLRPIMEWKHVSCLYIPILGGFKRGTMEVMAKKGRSRSETKIYYAKAVNKKDNVMLHSLEAVHEFLHKHELHLTIDLFSFNHKIDIETTKAQENWVKKLVVQDISDEQELLQIPAVNLVDNDIPVINEYLMQSVFADEKSHPRRTNVCCDCTDGCKDKLNCACFRQTLKCHDPDERAKLKNDLKIGYDFKMLQFKRQNLSGIYECNSKCKCNEHCINRVAQFPPKWKLQVFKDKNTEEKGWSVRTLNDIPAGAFVGSYTGEMFQETSANLKTYEAEWKNTGKWKYIVNLQVIQNADKESAKLPEVKGNGRNGPPKISFGSLDHTKIFGLPFSHGSPDLEARKQLTIQSQIETWDILKNIFLPKKEPSTKSQQKTLSSPKNSISSESSATAAAQRAKGKYSLRGTEKKNYTFSEIDTIFKKMPKKHSRIAPTLKCAKDLYLIDGYSKGNVGRYFNHSCDPNLFCQYVFVDTHDVRFPVVSFFAKTDIKAGTELTWSYNYDDDIGLGIVVECKCNAKECRGILIA